MTRCILLHGQCDCRFLFFQGEHEHTFFCQSEISIELSSGAFVVVPQRCKLAKNFQFRIETKWKYSFQRCCIPEKPSIGFRCNTIGLGEWKNRNIYRYLECQLNYDKCVVCVHTISEKRYEKLGAEELWVCIVNTIKST